MSVICVEVEQDSTLLNRETSHHAVMKSKELTPKQILSVRCSACGAATGEVCELSTGAPRTEPHRDRKRTAADAAERKLSKRSLSGPQRVAAVRIIPCEGGLA